MSSFDTKLSSDRSLRAIKTDKHTGWLNPTCKFTRKEINPLLTPRKLFKHKLCKKFIVNNRLTCMPAHRMINHEIKKIMRPTGGPIDMFSLNPKIICQILAEWAEGTFNQTFPSEWKGKSLKQMSLLCKHRYSYATHIRDRYYIFDEKNTVSTTTSVKEEIDAFVQFLILVIKWQGGMQKYINTSGFWRIDAMGGVQKSLGWYRTWPDEPGGCPGRICRCCGVPNIYSRRDIKPSSKENRSVEPNKPFNETYDDNYVTEEMGWVNKDGILYNEHPVAWRCRFCFADLAVMPIVSKNEYTFELVEQLIMHYIGGLLEQLKLTRVTDFYEDANESDKDFILSHDMALAKRLLVRLWNGCITVPTNVTTNELKSLAKVVPQLDIVRSIQANCTCPTLYSELAIFTGAMRSLMGANVEVIHGSLIKLRDQATTYSEFNNWLVVTNIPVADTSRTKLHGVASLKQNLEELLTSANINNGIYIIVPLETGLSNETSTKITYYEKSAHWCVNNKSLPLELNANSVTALNQDVIKTEKHYHYIVDMHIGNFCRLRFLSPIMFMSPDRLQWFESESTVQITLPIPQLAEFDNGKLSIGVKCVTKSLNRELFRALCIRNIQGKMEFKALCQYAIAYNMRRYTTGKVILKQEHVDYSVIHFHVFACLYTMRLQNNQNWSTQLIMQTMTQTNVKSLLAGIMNDLSKYLKLPEGANLIINMMDDASAILSSGKVPDGLKYLHSALPQNVKRSVKIFHSDISIVTNNVFKCPHRSCNHSHVIVANGCTCCGAVCEAETKLCTQCAPGDYSDLLWAFTFDSAMSKLHIKIRLALKNLLQRQTKPVLVNNPVKTTIATIKNVLNDTSNLQLSPLTNMINQILDKNKPTPDVKKLLTKANFDDITDEQLQNLESFLDPMILYMLTSNDCSVYNCDSTDIILPFSPVSYLIMRNVNATVDLIDLPNSEENSCGYEAYKYVTGSAIALDDFKTIVNSSTPFDESQLFYVAESENINLAIYNITTKNLLAHKLIDSDMFATIGYTESATPGGIGHFSPLNLTFLEKPRYYICEPTVRASERAMSLKADNVELYLTEYDGSSNDNLARELSLKLVQLATTEKRVDNLQILNVDNKIFLSNADVHNPKLNMFNFELTLRSHLAPHIVGTCTTKREKDFSLHLTVPYDIPPNLTDLHSKMMVDEVAKIVDTKHDILSMNNAKCIMLNQTRIEMNGLLQVDLGNTYVKPLDVLGIKHKDKGVGLVVVRSSIGSIALIDDIPSSDKFVLIVPKNSVMSNIKRICALQSASRDGTKLHMLLSNAKCINGYAGSGKTEDILKRATANTATITMTTISRDNLINRGYPSAKALTLERASWDKLSCTNLYIDEANMMDYLDVSLILTSDIETISMYYDEAQIGKFDSITLQGEVGLQLITKYPTHPEKWAFSTRFGGDLNLALKESLLPDLIINASKQTEFHIENLSQFNMQQLTDMVRKHRPTIILHAYTTEKNVITTWLTQICSSLLENDPDKVMFQSVRVAKTHSFQSHESPRVMYIQWRSSSSHMGLCRNKNYVLSALTRCKDYVVLVSAGHNFPIRNINDAVSSLGGNLVSLRDHLNDNLENTSVLLNKLLKQQMISTQVKNEELHLFKGAIYVGKYYKENEMWKGRSSYPMITERLTKSLHEKPGESIKGKVNDPVVITNVQQSRVRALAWIVDLVVNDGYLHLGAELVGLRVRKTPGCPYMAGIEIYIGKEAVLTITDAWQDPINRVLAHKRQNHKVGQLVSWFTDQHSGTFLDYVAFDSRMESYMMIDRAMSLPFAALQVAAKEIQLSGNTSQDNADWKNFIQRKHNLSTNNRWRSSVRHTMLIQKRMLSGWGLGTYYYIVTSNYKRSFSTLSQKDIWADVFNAALSTIKPIMRRTKRIGIFGMYMDPLEHMSKDTVVGKFLKEMAVKLETKSKDKSSLLVAVGAQHNDFIKNQYAASKNMTDIVTHNAMCITTAKSEFVDSYILTKFAVRGEGQKIGYLGLNSHLNPVANRHYVAVIRPNRLAMEPAWLATLELTRTWYTEYENRLKETMLARAKELQTKLSKLSVEQQTLALDDLKTLNERSTKALNVEGLGITRDINIVGVVAATLEFDDLHKLIVNSNSLILALPLNNDIHNVPDCMLPTMSSALNNELITNATRGYGKIKDVNVTYNVIDHIAGFNVYHVQSCLIPTIVNVSALAAQNPYVTVLTPCFEWSNVLTDKPLITAKSYKIDKRIMDRLLNYCIANDPSVDQLLAYVRSMLSTYDTSRTGVFPTYEATIEEAMRSTFAALVLYKLNYSGLAAMSVQALINTDLLHLLLQCEKLINHNEALTSLLTGSAERILNFINIDIRRLAQSTSELETSMKTQPPIPIVVSNNNLSNEIELTDSSSDSSPDSSSHSSTNSLNSSDSTVSQSSSSSSSSSQNHKSNSASHNSTTTSDSCATEFVTCASTAKSHQNLNSPQNNIIIDKVFNDNNDSLIDKIIVVTTEEYIEGICLPTSMSSTSKTVELARISSPDEPSNGFNAMLITHITLTNLLAVCDLPSSKSTTCVYWIYWQISSNNEQNKFVDQCIQSAKIMANECKVIVLNSNNEHKYVHSYLLQLKPYLTVQCWSDVVRMWLLTHFGGVWMDASTLLTNNFVPFHEWLKYKDGFLFYQKIQNNNYVLDNWLMVSKSNLPFMRVWFKLFLTVVKHGNNIHDAMPSLLNMLDGKKFEINENEDYLTMHETSKLALIIHPLPDYLMLPGFAGPLGWIPGGIEMNQWMNTVLNMSYKPQAGALKMIGLSRTVLAGWQQATGKMYSPKLTTPETSYDAIIIAVGTRGDVATMRGLRSHLTNLNLKTLFILVSNVLPENNEISALSNFDPIVLSRLKVVEDVSKQLTFVTDIFVALTHILKDSNSKYMFANAHVPTMMQMSRLTGSMLINVTGIPTFESNNANDYMTMKEINEPLITSITNTATRKIAKDLNLPWNYDNVTNGKKSLLTIANIPKHSFMDDRITTNRKITGSFVDGKTFSSEWDVILHQQIGINTKIDVILLGPHVSNEIMENVIKVIRNIPNRSAMCVLLSKAIKNLAKATASNHVRKLRQMYRKVEIIDSINVYTLKGRVKYFVSHGGQNTVTDALNLGATSVSFGTDVDQPYWGKLTTINTYAKPDSITDLLKELYNISPQTLKWQSSDMLLKPYNLHTLKMSIMQSHVQTKIKFTPITYEHCVRDCINVYLEQNNMSWNETALRETQPLMTSRQVIICAFSLNLNINMVRNDMCTHYRFNELWNTITLVIIQSETSDHATLATLESSHNCVDLTKYNNTIGLKYLAWPQLIGDTNVTTTLLQNLVTNGDFSTLTLNDPLQSKLLHTVNTTKLEARMGRVQDPITLINVQSSEGYCHVIDGPAVVQNKLLAVLTTNGWRYGLIVTTPDSQHVLITEEQRLPSQVMCLDLGCRIIDVDHVKLRTPDPTIRAPLNITTLNYLRSITTTYNYTTKIATHSTNQTLVYDFDNRSHDKYNECEIIANSDVTWMGEQPTDDDLATIFDTVDKPLRMIYYKGKIAWTFDDMHYGQQWLIKAFACDRQLEWVKHIGIIIYGRLNNWDKMDLTRFLMPSTPPQTLVDGTILKLSRKEWMTLLGVYGSAFEDIESKTLTTLDTDVYAAKVISTIISVADRGTWDICTAAGYVYTSKNTFYSAKTHTWFTSPGKGGDAFVNEEKISLGNSKDWWKKIGDEATILKELTPNPLTDTLIGGLPDQTINNWTNRCTHSHAIDEIIPDEELDFGLTIENNMQIFNDIVPADIQDMWLNTDLCLDLRQYAPINKGVIRSRENPDQIRETMKISLNEQTPMESRPVLTKWTFEEHRSIAGRLFSKIKYRKPFKTVAVRERLDTFIKTYFEVGFLPYTTTEQMLDIDAYETMLWISKRRDGLAIAQELNDLFTNELGLIPLNAINIHLKLESLLKENPIMHWGQHQARAIYWQRKAIAAISSPVFLKVKTRLKNSLRPKFIYADGLTPDQLCSKARNAQKVNWFFENDLSKQDRQTDKPIIDLEMEIYKLLGVTSPMINWWRTMHENWKFKARWNKGYAQEMRLTGQSTTSLGNLITNMQVHLEFIRIHDHTIKLVYMLGDDILIMSENKPDVSWIGKHTKEAHNMKSTQRLSNVSGLFCCMIAYKNSHGSAEIGPDYVRLRYRFELTNGVGEASRENIEARCQSYSCMLGKTPEVEKLARDKQWGIPLLNWYDQSNLIPAIANRYELDEFTVMNNYQILVNRLRDPKPIVQIFKTYTNVKVY